MLTLRPAPTPVVRLARHHYYLHIGIVIALTVFALGGGLLIARATNGVAARATPAPTVVTLARGMGLVSPYISVVTPGQAIEWSNDDAVARTLVTTPDRTVFLNPAPFSVTIPAGRRTALTLAQPGVYDYYDPSQAQWNAQDHHVAANPGVPHYPLAMEGILWVRGPIAGLAAAASNAIPSGEDLFATDVLAVETGGTITWHNADSDTHFVSLVSGWTASINPAPMPTLKIDGTADAPPSGGAASFTFTTPGLYYYYCPAHATIDVTWHRASAHPGASARPIPMEGFIMVGG